MLPPNGCGKAFHFWPMFFNPFFEFEVDIVDASITILAAGNGIDLRDEGLIFSLNHRQSNIRRRATNITSDDPCSIHGLEGVCQIFATGLCLRQIDSNFRVWQKTRQDSRAKTFEVSLGSDVPLSILGVSVFLTLRSRLRKSRCFATLEVHRHRAGKRQRWDSPYRTRSREVPFCDKLLLVDSLYSCDFLNDVTGKLVKII